MARGGEKYLLLTTFRRDGTPVPTPVWVVALVGGNLGFWTSSGSGKAKRLTHTQRVTLQPCDARRRTAAGSAPVDATAQVVSGSGYDEIRDRITAKYGFVTKVTKLIAVIAGKLKRKRIPCGDVGVVFTMS